MLEKYNMTSRHFLVNPQSAAQVLEDRYAVSYVEVFEEFLASPGVADIATTCNLGYCPRIREQFRSEAFFHPLYGHCVSYSYPRPKEIIHETEIYVSQIFSLNFSLFFDYSKAKVNETHPPPSELARVGMKLKRDENLDMWEEDYVNVLIYQNHSLYSTYFFENDDITYRTDIEKKVETEVVDRTKIADTANCSGYEEPESESEDKCLERCLFQKFNETYGCILPSIAFVNETLAANYETCTHRYILFGIAVNVVP